MILFLLLQGLTHAAKCHTLDRHELVNTILAALTAEATLLDTTEARSTLVYRNGGKRGKQEKLTEKQHH